MKKVLPIIGIILVLGLFGSILNKNEEKPKSTETRSAVTVTATATPNPTAAPTPTKEPDTFILVPTQPQASAAERSVSAERAYVLNMNTHKFHLPSCASVKEIKSDNREDVTMTRDEIIAMGYDPCGKCHP